MGKSLDLLNNVYGSLTVIEKTDKKDNRKVIWKCACNCGNILEIRGSSLISGNTKSCGCLPHGAAVKYGQKKPKITVSKKVIGQVSLLIVSQPIQPQQLSVPMTKLSAFHASFRLQFPNVSFTTVSIKNGSSVIVDNASKLAIFYIELDKYNQEYLVNNNLCANYAECKVYIKSIVNDLSVLGYNTIIVYENEWQDKQYKISNFIGSRLLQNSITVFARKCTIKIISKKEASDFLDTEHIQGPARISHSFYGLYDPSNTLIQVLTFGKHHRAQSQFNAPNIAILDRLAIKHNYNIPGGSSRLLKFAETDLKSRGFNKIISWADKKISSGKLYTTLGFTLFQDLNPDYSYYCEPESLKSGTCIVKGKQANKKSNLPGILPTQTELEFCRDIIKHYRVYDLGKMVFTKAIV